ncbi:MAG: hypothetical protein K8T20_12870, partial [Planctomycetes bacterium]|nr:hypothetical protein [Planctomycetota bacterium]
MKKLLPVFAILAVAAAIVPQRPAHAEDPKIDTDVFDNDQYGVKIWKPKGKDQWKIVGAGSWDHYFKDSGGVVFLLTKWAADNKDMDPQKSPPLVQIFGFRYDTQSKLKVGDWEGTPSSTKGFAKAISKQVTEEEYKNIKNEQETDKVNYPCGSFFQFSCYGEHKKYGGSRYLRIMMCKR